MGGLIAILLGAATACPAFEPPSTEPPLAGPRVESAQAERSLVRRGFDGRVERLGVPPEEAAIELLDLDEEADALVRRILHERARILDQVVVNNLDKLGMLDAAGASGDGATALRLAIELWRELAPLHRRGTLRDELAGALPEPQAARFLSLVDAYERALQDSASALAEEAGQRFNPRAFRREERLARLGEDVVRSIERTVLAEFARFEAIIDRLQLSEDQERAVRAMVREHYEMYGRDATGRQQRALLRRVLETLTPAQRRTLLMIFIRGE